MSDMNAAAGNFKNLHSPLIHSKDEFFKCTSCAKVLRNKFKSDEDDAVCKKCAEEIENSEGYGENSFHEDLERFK